MAETGATPEDVDDICELLGWSLPTIVAEPLSVAVPCPEPELRELQKFPETPPPVVTESRVVAILPARRSLEKLQAARQFVDWVRIENRCGTYSDREFSELSAEFFEAEDIIPIAANVFRPALELRRGDITKSRSDDHYRRNGKRSRQRCYRWTVHELEAESSSIPWTELPENRQARAA